MDTKINFTHKKSLSILMIILLLLIKTESIIGLLTPNLYAKETHNWLVQCIAQDAIDLFLIVPLLIVSWIFTLKGNLRWVYIWLGAICYNLYTFMLYCFTVHFNAMFLLYCATLGLTFYTIILFLIAIDKTTVQNLGLKIESSKNMAFYLMIVAILFLMMWLSDIVPAILNNQTPVTVIQGGMFTNGVQVIDLSFLLPAMLVISIAIFRGSRMASLIAPVFLSFSFIMSFALFGMMLYMYLQNETANLISSIMMIVLSTTGFFIFITLKEKHNS